MTDNAPRVNDPPPPPFAPVPPPPPAIASAIFNVIALILLFLGQITAGEIFVGLALVAILVLIFRGGSGTPGGPAASPPGNAPQPNRPAQNG